MTAAAAVMLAPLRAGAADDQAVRVEYLPPLLSIMASEVSLGELLTEVAVKVGFTVALEHAGSSPVTVLIERALVDDALRQLLRTENHTIVYRAAPQAAGIVERIVLLGPPSLGATMAEAPPAREGSEAAPDDSGSSVDGQSVVSGRLPPGAAPDGGTADDLKAVVERTRPEVSQVAEVRERAMAARPPWLPDTEP